jgi:hypothetical protein
MGVGLPHPTTSPRKRETSLKNQLTNLHHTVVRAARISKKTTMPIFPPTPLAGPVISLCAWTLLMEIWMYATRLPAYAYYKVDMTDPRKVASELRKVPPQIFWAGENFNHLMEQPTNFYAVVWVLYVLDAGDGLTVGLAWMYVGLRVAHSLVQATVNWIGVRFKLFAASGVVLAMLTGRAAVTYVVQAA